VRFVFLIVVHLSSVFAIIACADRAPAVAATIPCHPVSPAAQICGAGITSVSMNPAFRFQTTPVWCSAASMAMIIAYHGGTVSQSDIVKDLFDAAVPVALPSQAIPQYLNHTYASSADGSTSTTSGTSLSGNLPGVVAALANDHPLLILIPSHAMVLTAVYYYADAAGKPVSVAGAVVRDPYPHSGPMPTFGIPVTPNPGERALSPQEYRTMLAVFEVDVI
jgi:hypothetical protein